jgi:hypothetical protein
MVVVGGYSYRQKHGRQSSGIREMIRRCQISELHVAGNLASKFFTLANEPGTFSMDNFIRFWVAQYNAKTGNILSQYDIFGNMVAVIGFTLFNDPWTNELNAGELFWYSEYGNSAFLVRAAMKQAKRAGVKQFFMQHTSTLTPDKIEKFYVKLGFKQVFKQYRKEL